MVVGQQARCQGPVTRRLRVADRLDDEALLLVPLGGRAVQRANKRRRGSPQLQLQQVREKTVVAKPVSPRIQGGHEGVGILELLQHPLRARAAGKEIGQGAAHPVEHRGAQQHLAHLGRLALQDLRQQVSRHVALTA